MVRRSDMSSCPNCNSPAVIAYGSELPEEKSKGWWPLSHFLTLLFSGLSKKPTGATPLYIDQSFNFVSQRVWGLTRDPHLCPSCCRQSLHFELSALYD